MASIAISPPPPSLGLPLTVPPKTLCGPGPTNIHPRVQSTGSLPVIGHLHGEFTLVMDDIQAGIKYAFQTANQMTFALSGTGHAGLECSLMNLVEPGDIVAIVDSGVWGERVTDCVRRLGGFPQTIKSELGKKASREDVRECLEKHGPRVLYVAQGESSTGILEDVEMIASLCNEFDCLSIVDTVASLGAVPFYMDAWKVDCAYSGSQKVLGAPPGTAVISFSQKAVGKFRHRSVPVPSYYFDMALNAKYWDVPDFGPRGYHYTGAISSFYALREALALLCEQGLERSWQKHRDAAVLLHQRLQLDLNLSLLVEDEGSRLPSVTTVVVPEGCDWAKISAFVMQNYSLEISGGLGPTKGKVWRVGLMGPNADPGVVDLVVRSMKEALLQAKL